MSHCYSVCTKLAWLVKQSEKVCIFFSVITPDRIGPMQPRHHLWRWGMEGTERDHLLFCGMVDPVRVKSGFDCFPKSILVAAHWATLAPITRA